MGEAAKAAARRAAAAGHGWPAGTVPVGRLLRRAEAVAYWLAVAPLAARLPASLAYRVACWRGDWSFRYWPEKRSR